MEIEKQPQQKKLVENSKKVLETAEPLLAVNADNTNEELNNTTETIHPEALDRIWFERYEMSMPASQYEYFIGDNETFEEEMIKFISGQVRNPEFHYPKMDLNELLENEKNLQVLKEDLLRHENNEIVKNAYIGRLNQDIMANRAVISAATGDMEMFKIFNEYVYGKPSYDIFAYTLDKIHNEINQVESLDNQDLQRVKDELMQILPARVPLVESITIPTDEEFQLAKKITNMELGDLIKVKNAKERYSAQDIKLEFERALRELNADGWQAIVDSDLNRNFSMDAKSKRVYIPDGHEIGSANLEHLIHHEIGTHVKRRENGKRSKLMLLGIGLEGFEKGGEGIATMRDQTLKNTFKENSWDDHLAISLAYGLDGNPRDFRDTYTIMQKYFEFDSIKRGIDPQTALINSVENAWQTCWRVFRGTDCKTPGAAYIKDIIYAKGNTDVWSVVRNNPEEMMRFSVGRYDPSNPNHLWILDQLGITNEEMNGLKNR